MLAPKLACDISIVIKFILSDWSIENPRWRHFPRWPLTNAFDFIKLDLIGRIREFVVEINVLKMLKSPLNVP